VKLKKNPAVLQAEFENEQLLVHPESGRFFRLNVTAGRLYELLGAGATVESAKETLLLEFAGAPEELTAEIGRIVELLRAEKLLVEDSE
jgi:hypothetical protein